MHFFKKIHYSPSVHALSQFPSIFYPYFQVLYKIPDSLFIFLFGTVLYVWMNVSSTTEKEEIESRREFVLYEGTNKKVRFNVWHNWNICGHFLTKYVFLRTHIQVSSWINTTTIELLIAYTEVLAWKIWNSRESIKNLGSIQMENIYICQS